MNKDRAKEVFEKMRSEYPEYTVHKISEKPHNPGQYPVVIDQVRTQKPLMLNFDGKDWLGLDEILNMADGDISKISYYHKKSKNLENHILKKCGWDDKQLTFLGTMVYNVSTQDGSPIADVVSNRTAEQISVEWFVPNKDGDKISLIYSLLENKIVEDKTDPGINDEKSLNAFLDTIANTIGGFKGNFFPKAKVSTENKNKPSV